MSRLFSRWKGSQRKCMRSNHTKPYREFKYGTRSDGSHYLDADAELSSVHCIHQTKWRKTLLQIITRIPTIPSSYIHARRRNAFGKRSPFPLSYIPETRVLKREILLRRSDVVRGCSISILLDLRQFVVAPIARSGDRSWAGRLPLAGR